MNESRFAFLHQPFPTMPRVEQYVDVGNSDFIRKQCMDAVRRHAGPSVILGGPGLGKTMTCMRIVQSCANFAETVLLSSSQIASRADLLKSILYELRMPYRGLFDGELRLTLIERLQHRRSQNIEKVVIVVDEAQAISPRLLEELRLLTNLTANGQPCISLILCGSLKLEEMLCHPQLASLQQRIGARHFLHPLNQHECDEYIRHRIELAGVVADRVFDASAVNAISLVSGGIPRLIDQIAERTLAMDDSRNTRPLNAFDVERAWHAHQQPTPPWTDSAAVAAPSIASVERERTADTSIEEVAVNKTTSAEARSVSSESYLTTDDTAITSVDDSAMTGIYFQDADLNGWNGTSVELGFDMQSMAMAQRGTPPSAGMGLSSVFTRDADHGDEAATPVDRVQEIAESLNHFDYQAVTEALNDTQTRSSYVSANEPQDIGAPHEEHSSYPQLDTDSFIQELHDVRAGYGNVPSDLASSFNLEAPASTQHHDIEDDLFEMISNMNMESISIDPFLDLNTQDAEQYTQIQPEISASNLRKDNASEMPPNHNLAGRLQSGPQSFFSDIVDEGKEYIDVQLSGGNIFAEDIAQEDEIDRLRERLDDIDDIAASVRSTTPAFSLAALDEDGPEVPFDDRDIIVVEDDVSMDDSMEPTTVSAPVAKALLQSYSKLFQDLRG